MNKVLKRVLIGLGGVVGLSVVGGGGFVWTQVSAADASMNKVYDVSAEKIDIVVTPEVLARGEHLAMSLGGCAMADCHGSDLSGGRTVDVGLMGKFTSPNITPAGVASAYSEGELARLIGHGIKKDGRSVRFMPAHEVSWLPNEDIAAIVAYVRSVKPIEKPNGPLEIGMLAKILDRQDAFALDVARRIDHSKKEVVPAPEPTEKYGAFIARLCIGCHGAAFSGGAIPGTPPDFPIPTNLTPHESGMMSYTYEDFTLLMDQSLKKNGDKLDPFMPVEALKNLNEIERKALWAFLQSLPPTEFGNR